MYKIGCWIVVFMLLVLTGCAKPTSDSSRNNDVDMHTDDGHNLLFFIFSGEVETTTGTEQAAEADFKGELTLVLDYLKALKGKGTDAVKGLIDKEDVKKLTFPISVDKKEPVNPKPAPTTSNKYETRFHHTTTAYTDGGKSLVMCPGQVMAFDKCSAGGVNIPLHAKDEGRETYWSMKQEPIGDIVCTKGNKSYRYPALKPFVKGNCK